MNDDIVNDTPGDRSCDRFVACLLGGAVGDALGAPVEFLTRTEILHRHGAGGIRDFAPAYGGVGRVTDDTQMTLFTAEGLLHGHAGAVDDGERAFARATSDAYLRWLHTQRERLPAWVDRAILHHGRLVQEPALHHRRAPGTTCLDALRHMPAPGVPARNHSKGCGGVMRVAPVGLYGWRLGYPLQRSFELAAALAALTHGHPSGSLPAGALAVMVQALLDEASVREALHAAIGCLPDTADATETRNALQRAQALGDSALPPHIAIAELGGGWVAEEALAIAVYCALVASHFEEAVVLAVNHDGDSDSTGAIAGNLLGAASGVAGLPSRWLEALELREVIECLALELHGLAGA